MGPRGRPNPGPNPAPKPGPNPAPPTGGGGKLLLTGTHNYDGTITLSDGRIIKRNGDVVPPRVTVTHPSGSTTLPDGAVRHPNGLVFNRDGTQRTVLTIKYLGFVGMAVGPDGTITPDFPGVSVRWNYDGT